MVSLTMGNSSLPFGNGLAGDVQLCGEVALGEPSLGSKPVYCF